MKNTIGILFVGFFVIGLLYFVYPMDKKNEVKHIAYIAPTPYIANEDKLWNLIQDWRISVNKSSYIKDQKVCDFTSKRLNEVSDTLIPDSFSHSGFLSDKTKFNYFNSWAENLIQDYSTEKEMLTAWLNSPDHRKDLEADYKYSCLKCLHTSFNHNVCVQEFASY